MIYAIGAILSLAAALGAALDRRWARPLVWCLGVVVVLEWVVYTCAAFSAGYFRGTSLLNAAIALTPGIGMCVLTAYCCYVANTYIQGSR
jgi:hypothetical protein